MADILHYERSDLFKIRDYCKTKINVRNYEIKVSIIDYGLANLYNVSNAFKHVETNIEIIDKPNEVKNSEFLILPQ